MPSDHYPMAMMDSLHSAISFVDQDQMVEISKFWFAKVTMSNLYPTTKKSDYKDNKKLRPQGIHVQE